MSPDRSTFVREVDGLILILIDLHVPALTSRLHCSEAALQLSENIYTRIIGKESQVDGVSGYPFVTVSDVLDSNHLQILFRILDHVQIRTDWERFRSLASDLISPRTLIDTAEEAEIAVCNFAASIASSCRLSTRKFTLSELNELPDLESYL
jgi:hypothetical protein